MTFTSTSDLFRVFIKWLMALLGWEAIHLPEKEES